MSEHITIAPKILELNDDNSIYMTLHTRILSAEPNANKAEFTEDFILETAKNKDEIVGIPFVVDKESLESGKHTSLGHKLSSEGELLTDQIGSFVDFWAQKDEDDTMFLGGSIRIMKRFRQTCNAIKELYTSGSLATSCEVMVQDYEEISDDGIRKIHYNDGKNKLFASAIVYNPADIKAKPSLLVAEAYAEDIEAVQKGGDNLSKEKQYNNGIKVKYQGQTEMASLKFWEIEKSIYNHINPVDPENGGREYNYWIHTLFNDKVILEDDNDYKLYSVGYKVENNTTVLDEQDKWQPGSFQFVPDNVSLNELMEQNTVKVQSLEQELSNLKEEKEKMSKQKDLTVEELNEKVGKLEKKIASLGNEKTSLEETIVSQKEELVKAEQNSQELSAKIEELAPYKEKVEKAEKDQAKTALSEKYSKLLDEEVFKSEEVAEALESLDESKLNSIVVAEVSKKAASDVETASNHTKEVIVNASTQKDLVPQDKGASYWASRQ